MEQDREFIKRTTYVVDKRFQFRFVATFLVIVIVSLAVFSAGVAGYYWIRYMAGDMIFTEFIEISSQVTKTDENGNKYTESVKSPPIVGGRLILVLPPIIINNLVIMAIISILGIFYSHKIAGPAYRMMKDIDRVLAGDKGVRIGLRKGDKLKELATKLNELIEEYEKK